MLVESKSEKFLSDEAVLNTERLWEKLLQDLESIKESRNAREQQPTNQSTPQLTQPFSVLAITALFSLVILFALAIAVSSVNYPSPQYINTSGLAKPLSTCGFLAVSTPVVFESSQQCCFKVSSTLFMFYHTGVAVKIFDPGGCRVNTFPIHFITDTTTLTIVHYFIYFLVIRRADENLWFSQYHKSKVKYV